MERHERHSDASGPAYDFNKIRRVLNLPEE
jgi:hypothetical protein